MLCDICGKGAATVHLTEIVDEQMMELHLCDQCAQSKGAHIQEPFSLSDLLGGLVGLGEDRTEEKSVSFRCDNCGLTYKDFKKTGKLGCGRCYDVFKEVLLPVLKRIHGLAKHVGRVPIKTGVKVKQVRQVQELEAKLQKVIELEQFEEAAKIRDQLNELKNKQKTKPATSKKGDIPP